VVKKQKKQKFLREVAQLIKVSFLIGCHFHFLLSGNHFFLALPALHALPFKTHLEKNLTKSSSYTSYMDVAVLQEKYLFGDRLHPLSVVTQ